MKNLIAITVCSVLSITLLDSCSSHESRRYAGRPTHERIHHRSAYYGTVTDINTIEEESRTSGGGAVLGAVIGGVVGHQFGSGRGRDAATGIGAIGGAVAGNQIERRNSRENEIYRVTVRFENGRHEQFDYRDIEDLRVGDHVKVEHGQIYQLD
jgi:outer membrane lipoprotein SlyB